jgi:hypothetical protein
MGYDMGIDNKNQLTGRYVVVNYTFNGKMYNPGKYAVNMHDYSLMATLTSPFSSLRRGAIPSAYSSYNMSLVI